MLTLNKCQRCEKDVQYGNWCAACRVTRARQKRKRVLVEYKGGSCEVCGYNRCVGALDFHHLDPTTKKFRVGNGNTKSYESDIEEVDKCILVCSNCHREIHYK